MTRREFHAVAGGALLSLGCDSFDFAIGYRAEGDGRLKARPRAGAPKPVPGSYPLGLEQGRDGVLFVPPNAPADNVPLLVLLHGAGGRGAGILRRLEMFVAEAGIAVLSPDARDSTWDAVRGGFGQDVPFLDRALEKTFATLPVDPDRIAVGGFSDGASYALSLGLINGDLFRRIIAFSPGFYVGGTAQGRPRIFVSHGTADEILPIDRCSRVIVPRLKRQGYEVTFRQFDGGHDIPQPIAREGTRLVTVG